MSLLKFENNKLLEIKLDMEDLEELFEAFSLFDKDYNGVMSNEELGIVMQSISLNPTKNEINDMINEAETTNDQSIDFPEFLAFLSRKTIVDDKDESELKRAFKVFCNEETNMIDTESMKRLLGEIGEPDDHVDIERLLREADVDGDSQICFEGECSG